MTSDQESLDEPIDTNPRRLSENGQMAAIGVYGFLVLVGFFFGIVTGYEKPRPALAKKEKEPTPAKVVPETKPQPPAKPNLTTTTTNAPPGMVPNTQYQPDTKKEDTKKDDTKSEDTKPEMKKDDTKSEDPKPEPKTTEPKSEDPKPEPKPEPKTEAKPEPKTEPKKEESKEKPVAFKDVQAILRIHCANCHGAVGKPKADFDVTSFDKLMKSPSGIGKSVVAGDLKKSGMLVSILSGDMPPEGKPKPTDKEIAILTNWILQGAKPRRRPIRRTKN